MNILKIEDLINYLRDKQVFTLREVTNNNMKTVMEQYKVYTIYDVVLERTSDKSSALTIWYTETDCICFYRTASDLAIFAEMKSIFLPVAEMYEQWKGNELHELKRITRSKMKVE